MLARASCVSAAQRFARELPKSGRWPLRASFTGGKGEKQLRRRLALLPSPPLQFLLHRGRQEVLDELVGSFQVSWTRVLRGSAPDSGVDVLRSPGKISRTGCASDNKRKEEADRWGEFHGGPTLCMTEEVQLFGRASRGLCIWIEEHLAVAKDTQVPTRRLLLSS